MPTNPYLVVSIRSYFSQINQNYLLLFLYIVASKQPLATSSPGIDSALPMASTSTMKKLPLTQPQIPKLPIMSMKTSKIVANNISSTSSEILTGGGLSAEKQILNKSAVEDNSISVPSSVGTCSNINPSSEVTTSNTNSNSTVNVNNSNNGAVFFVFNNQTHTCRHCQKIFISSPALTSHLQSEHNEPSTSNTVIIQHADTSNPEKCTYCQRLWISKSALELHMQAEHQIETQKRFQCDFCPRSYHNR